LLEFIMTSGARCIAPRFGITKALPMLISDIFVLKRSGKNVFGKSWTSRLRQFTDVNDTLNTRLKQGRKEVRERRAFIADRINHGHVASVSSNLVKNVKRFLAKRYP